MLSTLHKDYGCENVGGKSRQKGGVVTLSLLVDKIPRLALSNRFLGYYLSRTSVAPPLSQMYNANVRKI